MGASEKYNDQLLEERVQKGDSRAFDLLVKKYQSRLAKLVSRYIRNADDVQDVVQDTFIKAYRALPNFRGESAFYTWIYRIAINTAKNQLVSNSRKSPANSVDAQEIEKYDASDWLTESATPERELFTSELKTTVNTAMQDLPPDLREAITLREIEGLSYEEIAQVMDCPIGTVRSRIFRAREAIDEKLKPLLDSSSHGVHNF